MLVNVPKNRGGCKVFLAQVMSTVLPEDGSEKKFQIMYYEPVPGSDRTKFIPNHKDIDEIFLRDIKVKVQQPTLNQRNQYVFAESLDI